MADPMVLDAPGAAPGIASGPRRRDAVLRREALLNAAIECFETRGYSVSLEEIADHAGVGRGTLYRNFKDRVALTLAIFAREIEKIGDDDDAGLPLEAAMRAMVLRGARMTSLFYRMSLEMQLTAEQIAGFRALGTRVQELMTPMVERARAEGRLRADITPADMMVAMRMLGGLCKPINSQSETEAYLDAGLSLLLRGMGPR
ncbi:MAG: TetR/AcrR family transcriptional regulator [Sphingomonadales bacterium]|nr:TetR/AcrR family transcriptional regulator [Sphingomonadales bacterium]MDE2170116.1 TetR/AcrR family transcriptional regulator [Sphingomonadales bacterium]